MSIINIHYLTRKSTNRAKIKKILKIILNEQNLISIDKFIIENSLDSEFKDFEDGVQYYCARRINADVIITDNKKDFKASSIRVMTAKEFYEEFIK